ncbi:MAG: hypothetical protein QOI66_2351, partial [Myxococcales bacterium]|nr:hypothetical protein [Myxococcales bacterium]
MKNESVSVRFLFVAELFLTLLGVGAGGCGDKPDTPQLGVTHAAVTAEGIGPELTQQGDIIAKVTHPMGGGGSRNLEVIRDGQKPSADDPANPQNQYDTFDNTTPDQAKTDDWVGYQFLGDVTFARVAFQAGMNFDDGGWFAALNVQVRHSGTWTAVSSLVVDPPYQPGAGHSYDSYRLDFAPITGDAIRIEGAPGGSARFISVAELQVWAAPGTSGAPAAAPLGA